MINEWFRKHSCIKGKIIVESERRGKLQAILRGLNGISKEIEIIVLTDDDCIWDKEALRNVLIYFADPSVGSVTGSIEYINDNANYNIYRNFYNKLRIAESKYWSTPLLKNFNYLYYLPIPELLSYPELERLLSKHMLDLLS